MNIPRDTVTDLTNFCWDTYKELDALPAKGLTKAHAARVQHLTEQVADLAAWLLTDTRTQQAPAKRR